MSRQPRKHSMTHVYHVMLCGINMDEIFKEKEDYNFMLDILSKAHERHGYTGKLLGSDGCNILAYCILPNHMHIIIWEKKTEISKVMRSIEDKYVFHYNRKYKHVGTIFLSRFQSEPVNNTAHFLKLLSHIHHDPVKEGLCRMPEDYEYSSWKEYFGDIKLGDGICAVDQVIEHIGYEDLSNHLSEDNDDECMDIDSVIHNISDKDALEILMKLSGCKSDDEFKHLPPSVQLENLKDAYIEGISIRQCARLSTISYYYIRQYFFEKLGHY